MELLPEDLEVLQKFPLITIEKWQGMTAFSTNVCNTTGNCNSTNQFLWQEDAWVAAARQIKAVAPKASIVVWMDSVLVYTGWTWPPAPWHKREPHIINHTHNPDANWNCATGHFRASEFLETHPDYLLRNASEMLALEPWSGCHVYDHTQSTTVLDGNVFEFDQHWSH